LSLLSQKSIEVIRQKSFVRSHSSEVTEIETATQTIATATVEISQPVKKRVDVEEKKITTTPFPSAQTEQLITPESIEVEVAPNSIEPLLQPQNKPSNPPSQLKPRLEYLAWANNATQLIRSSKPSKKDIDVGVAMLMMKRGKTTSEISLVLSQSDVALSLQKHHGATSEAIDSSQNYVNSVIETAANLRRELLQQKRRDLER
jgi:hypothetical protein